MLNRFFVSTCTFNQNIPRLSKETCSSGGLSSQNFPPQYLCSVTEIMHLLMALDIEKATGPDGIAATMLVAAEIAPSLTRLFNLSLTTGCIPHEWKCSNIVPVPKTKALSNAQNYHSCVLLVNLKNMFMPLFTDMQSHII